jgi:hypothetical protein
MVAAPTLPKPKCPGIGMKGNIKRWTQQEITKYTGGNVNKPSKRQQNKNSCKINIYNADITSRTNKQTTEEE